MQDFKIVNQMLRTNFHLLENKILPQSFGKVPIPPIILDSKDKKEICRWREKFVNKFGYSLYSEDWIKPLAKWIGNKKCLEIQAGSGMLAYFLKQCGVKNIQTTDNFVYKNYAENQLIEIEKIDFLEAIKKYGKKIDLLILSWPTGINNEANQALQLMRDINPSCQMIYIGPTNFISTPNFLFLKNMKECDSISFKEAVSNYPNWIGYNDKPLLIK